MCNKIVKSNYLPSNSEYILGINDDILTGLIYSKKNYKIHNLIEENFSEKNEVTSLKLLRCQVQLGLILN